MFRRFLCLGVSSISLFVQTSCSSLSKEKLESYKLIQIQSEKNDAIETIVEYLGEDVKNPQLFKDAMFEGAQIVGKTVQTDGGAIPQDSFYWQNAMGQRLIELSNLVHTNDEALVQLGLQPEKIKFEIKVWSIYSLAEINDPRYFYNFFEVLGGENWINIKGAQQGAIRGIYKYRELVEDKAELSAALAVKLHATSEAFPTLEQEKMQALQTLVAQPQVLKIIERDQTLNKRVYETIRNWGKKTISKREGLVNKVDQKEEGV